MLGLVDDEELAARKHLRISSEPAKPKALVQE
jgi:hypothetical protein